MGLVISTPASPGDLLDRIAILAIKSTHGLPVATEAAALRVAWLSAGLAAPESLPEYAALHEVNAALWDIEDRLRACEARGDFGPSFVEDARLVYRTNDRRAALKRQVNERLGSAFREEKRHVRY